MYSKIKLYDDILIYFSPTIITSPGYLIKIPVYNQPYYVQEDYWSLDGTLIKLTSNITKDNNIWVNINLNMCVAVKPGGTILRINDICPKNDLHKYIYDSATILQWSSDIFTPNGNTLLILGPNITFIKKTKKPLINLPIVDRLTKIQGNFKIKCEYEPIILFKFTIITKEEYEKTSSFDFTQRKR